MPLSAVKPECYRELLAEKTELVAGLFAPFQAPDPEIFCSAPTGFRMRAEFRVWHDGDDLDYVMFRPGEPKSPIPIDTFPIACEPIQKLMPRLRQLIRDNTELRRKLFQVEFLSTLAGETLASLIYHRRLETGWEREAEALRQRLQDEHPGLSIIGRSRKQKIVLGRNWVEEQLEVNGETFSYNQYEQSFTQPNARVNTQMIEWACQQARDLDGDMLELYCGNGNFTLPLSRHFQQVVATELSKVSVKAARENIAANRVDNVQMIRLSAEEVTQAMAREREFRRLAELPKPLHQYDLRTLFVDPPRAGLDPHTVAMAAGFERIIYISCNPHTLADNLASLSNTHRVARFALFDQFPYTEHMECGVLLLRR